MSFKFWEEKTFTGGEGDLESKQDEGLHYPLFAGNISD